MAGCGNVNCCRCAIYFYFCFNCIVSVGIAVYASYLLIFHQEAHIPRPRTLVIYFLVVPLLLNILSTLVGWLAMAKRRPALMRCFAVLIIFTVLAEVGGCIWCFIELPSINKDVDDHMSEKFTSAMNVTDDPWLHSLQTKLKCCGLHGPTDYYPRKVLPVSCSDTDLDDNSDSTRVYFWKGGCSSALASEVQTDLTALSMAVFVFAFLQVPGIFVSWCFSTRIALEGA